MQNQRFILFIILSALIVMLWSAWEAEHRAAAPAPTSTKTADAGVPAAPSSKAPQSAESIPDKTQLPESGQRVSVTTDLFHAEIDTVGGDIRVLDLRKHPVSLEQRDIPFRLFNDDPEHLYIAQSGLIAHQGNLPTHRSRYRAESNKYVLTQGLDSVDVRLNWTGPDGLRVSKIYTFHRNDYAIGLRYEITNHGRQTREIYLYSQLLHRYVEKKSGLTALPTYTGGVVYTTDKKYQKVDFDEMREKPLSKQVDGGWVAMLQHYFVGAWLPKQGEQMQFYTSALDANDFAIGYKTLTPTQVKPGDKGTLATVLYAGPKEHHRLEKAADGLVLTVDYGWLTFIAAPLFWCLEWFHKLVGNWGWAIILLTLLIKLVFYPLSVASYRSMAHMKKVQPRIQQMKERYKDDKQKFQQSMMELYKEEKINPLGGCLPILIQIPVFIALYWVLLESVELRLAPWALWIKDLSTPDPYFVLPILMGATMLAQQWLNPQPLEDMQKKIMYLLPVVFTFMFLFFPSGLVLYWVVQNFLSIAQQWSITRAIEGKK